MQRERKLYPSAKRPPAHGAAAALLAVAAVGVAVVGATAAYGARDLGQETGVDLDVTGLTTPVPKDTELWRYVAGAKFGKGGDPKPEPGSPTPVEVDFHAVARLGGQNALFAGSIDEAGARAPVVYRYTKSDTGAERIEREGLPGAGRRGFVGAVSWIDPGRALAVGGTGRYPDREPEDGKNPCERSLDDDPAGRARVWLLEGGAWRELEQRPDGEPGDELPDGMGALTALDFYEPDPGQEIEFGVAGGLCQLWHWSDGGFLEKEDGSGFEQPYSPGSPVDRVANAQHLRFRVHSVVFPRRIFGSPAIPRALAATAGCCLADETKQLTAAPAALAYWPSGEQDGGDPARGRWYAFQAGTIDTLPFLCSTGGCGLPQSGEPRQLRPNSIYALTATAEPDLNTQGGAGSASQTDYKVGAVFSPAGTPDPNEPASKLSANGFRNGRFRKDTAGNPNPRVVGLRPPDQPIDFSSTRLADADGDAEANQTLASGTAKPLPPGNGVPDWSVGTLTATGQGIVLAANAQLFPNNRPSTTRPLPCTPVDDAVREVVPSFNTACGEDAGSWLQNSPGQALDSQRSYRLLKVPTYGLNAVDVADDSKSGWAVGAHGAIVALDTEALDAKRAIQAAAGEPSPPKLDARHSTPLAERGPYEEFSPATPEQVAAVPPLTAQPRQRLPEPQLVPAGSPDPTGWSSVSELDNKFAPFSQGGRPDEDVGQIVMSRTGEEGWAIGAHSVTAGKNGNLTLFHYDGSTWSRCDALGAGPNPPDPACEALAPLRSYRDTNGNPKPVNLVAAARVPLESDDDPSNDDDFEVVAIGTAYRGPEQPSTGREEPVILRYSDGRWDFEAKEARGAVVSSSANQSSLGLRDVAFTAPDDGWILVSPENTGKLLFRFNGKIWIDCRPSGEAGPADERCGDPDNRTQINSAAGTQFSLSSAGERVYLYGSRRVLASSGAFANAIVPAILYHERDGRWTDGSAPGEDGGGFDPGFRNDATTERGAVQSLSVAQRPDGGYEGWAYGYFATSAGPGSGAFIGESLNRVDAILMRLHSVGDGAREEWRRFHAKDALHDYLAPPSGLPGSTFARTDANVQVTVPDAGGNLTAFIASRAVENTLAGDGLLFGFNRERQRWEPVEQAYASREGTSGSRAGVRFQALAPDGRDGFWAAVRNGQPCCWSARSNSVQFLHYTDRPRKPVFEEAPHPLGDAAPRLAALAGSPDGSVWAATDSNLIARYDRLTGWETARIPGWDPGRIVTNPSRVTALAAGPGGHGLAVGPQGRIADLAPEGVRLNPAAGRLCDAAAPAPPCGTGRDLHAAALAPDGSAIVAGERLALLWRPADGEFRAIAKPPTDPSTRITGASMPEPGRAYLTTDTGLVFAGELRASGGWRWRLENLDEEGRPLSFDWRDPREVTLRLNAIAVDRHGRGYAVGDEGLILERTGDGERPWRRLKTRFLDYLSAVALPAGEGRGALIGGENGIVLTRAGDAFELARPAGYFGSRGVRDSELRFVNADRTGMVAGLALLPGVEDGQVEAWVALRPSGQADSRGGPVGRGDDNRVLHYASEPREPLLRPAARAEPLPDTPPRRPEELAFAAFGKSDCPRPSSQLCPEMIGTDDQNEVVARAVAGEVLKLNREGRIGFALFSGDATDSAGLPAHAAVDGDRRAVRGGGSVATNEDFWNGSLKHRRWGELVADRLVDAGLPLYGAIGSGDLAEAFACDTTGLNCVSTKQGLKAGDNVSWRQAMLERPRPWGAAARKEAGRYGFRPLGDSPLSLRVEDAEVSPAGDVVPPRKVAAGGASTHYALDVRDGARDGAEVARLVFVDNSLRSLAASDPIQQPLAPRGGQSAFLERMLCFRGERTSTGERCTRSPGQRAIVVANTPTYSYGPGALTETASDAVAFEALLLRHRASVVVSGRLGWNALYWATAPGLHYPCPGDPHPEPNTAPDAGRPPACGRGPDGGDVPTAESVADGLASTAPPAREPVERAQGIDRSLRGPLPFVVASSAGGKFGSDQARDSASASQGFWHGYTVVRLDPSGDPASTIVEQRPVLDWISLTVSTHVLRPGQRLTLRGVGREPLFRNLVTGSRTRFNRIDSPAITHRYDLLLADEQRPWLPKRDADGGYVPLPADVATVDSQSGRLRVGRGNQPRTFAIAMLSVGEKAATWPLVFEPRRSFKPKPAEVVRPLPPPIVGSAGGASISAPPEPTSPTPQSPQLNLPTPPPIPGLPTPTANPPAPPAPPAPPPPPVSPSATPLDLVTTPIGLNIAPQATVIPPPAPPIQPAPPGGARREARQRQAATAKSEEGAGNVGEENAENVGALGGDPVDGPNQATRRERVRPAPSITVLNHTSQPSAWPRTALYTGGLTLASAILALGWITARPRPRRRPPERPAPAYARRRPRRFSL